AARLVADEHAGGALTAGVVVASAAGEGALVLVQEVRVRTGALALGGIHAGLHAGSGGSLSDAGGRLGAGDVDARIAQVDPQAHAAARDVVEDAPGHDTAAVALRLHALVRRAVVRADTYLQRDLRVVALARDDDEAAEGARLGIADGGDRRGVPVTQLAGLARCDRCDRRGTGDPCRPRPRPPSGESTRTRARASRTPRDPIPRGPVPEERSRAGAGAIGGGSS